MPEPGLQNDNCHLGRSCYGQLSAVLGKASPIAPAIIARPESTINVATLKRHASDRRGGHPDDLTEVQQNTEREVLKGDEFLNPAFFAGAKAACDASDDDFDIEHPWRYGDEPWRYFGEDIADWRWHHIEDFEVRELLKSLHEPDTAELGRRVKRLIDSLEEAPSALFWPVFLNTWFSCAGSWPYQPKLLDMLRQHAQQEPATNYMHPAVTEFFEGLPPVVTAFRGCGRGRVLGLSWSPSQRIANLYAGAHLSHPVIATAKVPRSAIFAVFVGSNCEIVVDPQYLREVQFEAVV
jgi:hypothetical protein